MAAFEVILAAEGAVTYPLGFKAGGTVCGLKASGKTDLGVLLAPEDSICFGAFTLNAFAAAPVQVCKEYLAQSSRLRAVVVNSGNANACTGADGLENAYAMTRETAALLNLEPSEVAVCSTGVIGVSLDIAKVKNGLQTLVPAIAGDKGNDFAAAIMTTDTREKQVAVEVQTAQGPVRLGGCSKGAGMIHPNMATMLAFLTTDLKLDESFKPEFSQLVDDSFNSITVDGDTSTNDTVLLFASGASGVDYQSLGLEDQGKIRQAIFYVFAELAKLIIRDGEGATKFVHLTVEGADSRDSARTIARYIANSKLVKTAMFGQDPNWGRIVASLGSIAPSLDTAKVFLGFDDVTLVAAGQPVAVDKEVLRAVVCKDEYEIRLKIGEGHGRATVWTCDLSYEYVKINAEYTT